MPSQELSEAQSECSTVQHTTLHEPTPICPPFTEGSPAGVTSPSAQYANSTGTGTLAPEFLATLWRLRLELAIFKLERRALPVLNVFRNQQPLSGHAVWPLRSTGSDVRRGCPVAPYDASQRHRISDVNATSLPAQALKAHAQPSKWHTRCGVHKAWLKWRGPLPRTNTLRRHHLRGSAVFAQRCRHGRRLVTLFWLRQRVDPHVIRWLKLCSIALPPPRMVAEKARPRRRNGVRT